MRPQHTQHQRSIQHEYNRAPHRRRSRAVSRERRDVAEVRQQETDQPRDEAFARQHQQHVARERAYESRDNQLPVVRRRRVFRLKGDEDDDDDGQRLEDVHLSPLILVLRADVEERRRENEQ